MLNQAKYIASQGHKISIITNTIEHNINVKNLYIEVIKLPKWYEEKNSSNIFFRLIKTLIFQPVIIFKLFVLISRSKFKIIHLVNSKSRFSLYSIIIAKIKGIKIVNSTTLYGDDDPITIQKKWGKIFKWVFFDIPDMIVNNSPLLAEACKEANIPLEKIWMIPNPVDIDLFKPVESEEEKLSNKINYPFSAYSTALLTVSLIDKRKNIDELIHVFKEVNDLDSDSCLVIAGPTDWNKEYYKNLRTLIDRYDLLSRVFFLGIIDDVHRLMKACDIFVFASAREGMPNVLLEAMSSGLPIVAKRIPDITDMILNESNGIVVNGRGDFVKGILELINDGIKCQILSKNARDTAVSKFGEPVVISRYIELYSHLSSEVFK